VVGLHTHGLAIEAVEAGGDAASFEICSGAPTDAPCADDAVGNSLSPAAAAAARALVRYERALRGECEPNLLVTLPGSAIEEAAGGQLVLRLRYSAENPASGVRFWGPYACSDGLLRRTRAWVPCVDVPAAAVQFQVELTVRTQEVAVGPGELEEQTWADPSKEWKTFCYKVALPCAPCDLAFAAGPFKVVPTPRAAREAPVTMFVPSSSSWGSHCWFYQSSGAEGGSEAAVEHTSKFLSLAMSFVEGDHAFGTRLALPSLQQVFLPPQLVGPHPTVGAGIQVASTSLLIDPRAVEPSLAARQALVKALARQWFGLLLRPKGPEDAWLVEGLCGWLEEQYTKRYLGRNEASYRRWTLRPVVAAADSGDAPPLAIKGGSTDQGAGWGPLYGTDALDPSPLRQLKASTVVGMLERKAGEDLFRKHVQSLVVAAVDPVSGPEARLVVAVDFAGELGRAGDFRLEMAPFFERWIYGRGAPHVTAGFVYHRRKSVLEIAMKQTGSKAAKRAADTAELAALREGKGTDAGVIKVVVREAETSAEHPVHLGGEAAVLERLRVNPEVKKAPGRRGGRRKKEADEEAARLAREKRELEGEGMARGI
jgi:transcription initiation factor TFIID subunit 2